MRTSLIAYLSLLRWPNLLMIAGGTLLMLEGGARISGGGGLAGLPLAHVLLAPLCLMLIAAWGYVLNDVFDVATDQTNQRRRPLAEGRIGIPAATTMSRVLLLLALGALSASALWLPLPATLILFLALLLTWSYSPLLQRIPLAALFTVALLVSFTVVLPVLLIQQQPGLSPAATQALHSFLVVYGLFALLTTLTREQAKDLADLSGDQATGKRSLAVWLGWKIATRVLLFSLVFVFALTAVIALSLWEAGMHNVLFVGVVFVAVPLGMSVRLALLMQDRGDAATLSATLKWIMVAGLLTALFI
ncbi:MAG TPA: UbiA family prenyltransferase [Bacteroidales bacterium]|nr:UbiA family prenyltransferase [Bacteroidales bacterium]HRZ76894.1 UbiA family prenyltransferase [Bacteroidales bacterium]